MSYTVKEVFATLQGEGAQAGRSAVFLRFAGCNLWSGRQADRYTAQGSCARWCDTDFVGGTRYETAEALALAVGRAWSGAHAHRLCVCTGGEPLLQLDPPLIDALHALGFKVAVETNGTRPVPNGVDWVTVSPKAGESLAVAGGDELKVVFPQLVDLSALLRLSFTHFYLQPMDGPRRAENTARCVSYCLDHPPWRLSLQTHKFAGFA